MCWVPICVGARIKRCCCQDWGRDFQLALPRALAVQIALGTAWPKIKNIRPHSQNQQSEAGRSLMLGKCAVCVQQARLEKCNPQQSHPSVASKSYKHPVQVVVQVPRFCDNPLLMTNYCPESDQITKPSSSVQRESSNVSFPTCNGFSSSHLFQQQRLQRWIQLLPNILKQHRQTKLHGVLERAKVLPALTELDHLRRKQKNITPQSPHCAQ